MVGSMYQAETPVGLCKYKDNEKGDRTEYDYLDGMCIYLTHILWVHIFVLHLLVSYKCSV